MIIIINMPCEQNVYVKCEHQMCRSANVSAPICHALSGPFAQCLSQVAHEQVRVDTSKCE